MFELDLFQKIGSAKSDQRLLSVKCLILQHPGNESVFHFERFLVNISTVTIRQNTVNFTEINVECRKKKMDLNFESCCNFSLRDIIGKTSVTEKSLRMKFLWKILVSSHCPSEAEIYAKNPFIPE